MDKDDKYDGSSKAKVLTGPLDRRRDSKSNVEPCDPCGGCSDPKEITQKLQRLRKDPKIDGVIDALKSVSRETSQTTAKLKKVENDVVRVKSDVRKVVARVNVVEDRLRLTSTALLKAQADVRAIKTDIAKLKSALDKKADKEDDSPFKGMLGLGATDGYSAKDVAAGGIAGSILTRYGGKLLRGVKKFGLPIAAGVAALNHRDEVEKLRQSIQEREKAGEKNLFKDEDLETPAYKAGRWIYDKLDSIPKDAEAEAERGAGTFEKTPTEEKRKKYHNKRKKSAYDDIKAETQSLKEEAARAGVGGDAQGGRGDKPIDLSKIPQARASFFGFGRKKKPTSALETEHKVDALPVTPMLTFRDQFERQRIEEQKSEFMRFGKLPTGFEFVEGHMGRLGTPGALKAAGIQPYGGNSSSSSSIPSESTFSNESPRTSPFTGQHKGTVPLNTDSTGVSNEPSKVGNWKGPGDPQDNLANVSSNERRIAMYQAFRKQGISHQGAVMMAGEIGRENDYRANYMFGNHVDSNRWNSGIMSWNSDRTDMNINSRQGRRGQLLKFLGEKGHLMEDGHTIKPTRAALEAQAEFLVKEMETGSHIGGMSHPKAKSVKALLEKMRSGEQLDYHDTHRILGKDLIRWAYDRLPQHRQRMAQHEQGLLKDLKARPDAMGTEEKKDAKEPPKPEITKLEAIKSKRSAKDAIEDLRQVHEELEAKNGGAPVDAKPTQKTPETEPPKDALKIPDAQDLDAPVRQDSMKKRIDEQTVRMPNDDPVRTNPKMSGQQYGKGPNLSENQLVRGGVNPVLAKAQFEGAKLAFGDPSDPKTRYVLQAHGGFAARAMKHGQGLAIDAQIFDRKTGKFVGGNEKPDIMSNAYDNPKSFRYFEAMHQGAYKYLYDKYGKQTADQLSSGLYFSAVQGSRGDGFGVDNMHLSMREGQRHGRIATGLTNEQIKAWIARHGGLPSRAMGDPAKWQSEFHPDYDPKNALQPQAANTAKDQPEKRDPKVNELQNNLMGVPEDLLVKAKPKASFPAVLPKGEPAMPRAAPPGLQAPVASDAVPSAKPADKPNLDLLQPPPDLVASPVATPTPTPTATTAPPADARPSTPADRGPQMPVAPPSDLQGPQTPNLKMPTEAPPDLQAPNAAPNTAIPAQPEVPGGNDNGFRRNDPETQAEGPGSSGMGQNMRCFV